MRLPKTILDYFLIAMSLLAFWYAKSSYELEVVGLRGSRFYKSEEPILYWFGFTLVAGVGLYLLGLVFIAVDEDSTIKTHPEFDSD